MSISGGQKPAVRIQANPTALSSYGISLEDVRTALQQTSVNQAKGNFDGPQQSYQIDANDQILTSKDYQPIVVAYRNGAPVMLSDVAAVIDGAENAKQAAWMNRRARRHRQHPAATRRKYHPGGGQHQSALAATANHLAACHSGLSLDGPHHNDSGLSQRRSVLTHVDRGARGDGDLSVPAKSFGNDHSQRRRAAFAGGTLARDVSGWLQPQQPDADGPDDFNRLCSGRRNRDD